jgi:hypothetical protein
MKKEYAPYISPFIAFLVLTYAGAWLPDGSYLLYPVKTLVVGGLLFYYRKSYTELRFSFSWLALLVGILVFILWIVPENWAPHLGWSRFNPYPASFKLTDEHFENMQKEGLPEELSGNLDKLQDQTFSTELAFLNALEEKLEKDDFKTYREMLLQHAVDSQRAPWLLYLLIFFRLLGAVIVVPIFEELFWRSFALRWLIDENFSAVPIGTFTWFSASAVILAFGFEHHRWLAGIFAGLLYHALLYYKKDLSACVIAHAVTNLLLGIYVLLTQQWSFW